MTGAPYLPGFGRCGIPRLSTDHSLPATGLVHGHRQSCTVRGRGLWGIPDICQNRADMGHPGIGRKTGLLRNPRLALIGSRRWVPTEACPEGRVDDSGNSDFLNLMYDGLPVLQRLLLGHTGGTMTGAPARTNWPASQASKSPVLICWCSVFC